MSFSSEVKQELYKHISAQSHCRIAETAAILHFCGSVGRSETGFFLQIRAENGLIVRKCFTLLQKAFNMSTEVEVRRESAGGGFFLRIGDETLLAEILRAIGVPYREGGISQGTLRAPVDPAIVEESCCKRAFLRGAFLSAGSVSDPKKGYHLEIVCSCMAQAEQIVRLLSDFEIEAHLVTRKKYAVVYLKEGSGIADFLNVTEAHIALLEFENSRVVREVRNTVNRRVNCETANIAKTVTAASRQVEDILLLRDRYGFEKLPASLRQMAEARLEYPDAPLRELGACLDPPVGKSGVNHRLRKLCELADKVRF